MSHFYTAKFFRPDGKRESRDFFLPSVSLVRKEIARMNATVIAIDEMRHTTWQREWYSRDFKLQFLRAIAMQARSGKSPGQALATVISNETNPRKRIELDAALQMIEKQGRDFSDAIAQLGLFDRTAITILRAGERSGILRAVDSTVKYLIERRGNLKKMISGLGWVAFEFLSALTSTFEVQFQVLPWLEAQISQSKNAAEVAQFGRDVAIAYWVNGAFLVSAVGVIAGGVAVVLGYHANMEFRTKVDDLLLKIPVLNRFLVDGVMGQSFDIAALMLASHVTFFEVATILSEVAAVPLVRRYWKGVATALRSTSSPTDALGAGGMLYREELQLLQHHEDSHQLADSFQLLAENRAESFKRGRTLVISIGFGVMVAYSLISIAIVLFLYLVYSATLNASLMEYAGGGV